MLLKLQLWGAAILAFLLVVGSVLLQVFGAGKKRAESDAFEEAARQGDLFDDSIIAGHRAGNDIDGLLPVDQDPNNRANRKRG